MFDMKFKVILYKMFIQSSFEFCSTLFFDLKISSELDRLDKCFSRSINKYLNIKLWKKRKTSDVGNNKSIALNLSEQAVVLSPFEILPRRLRSFYHFIFYTYINYNRKNTSLFKKMISYKNTENSIITRRYNIRRLFNPPLFLTNLYNYSYLTISIRFLNSFLFGFLKLKRNSFMKFFRDSNILIFYHNIYLKDREVWK